MTNPPNGLQQLIFEAATEIPVNLTTPEITQLAKLVATKRAQRAQAGQRLSPRLHQVLQGLAAGESTTETAARLGISEDTAKTHRRRLYEQLGARSGAHAVAIAGRRGLLVPIGEPVPSAPSKRKGGRS
jgi:DNA-binding NarL/FixJ family response regulator